MKGKTARKLGAAIGVGLVGALVGVALARLAMGQAPRGEHLPAAQKIARVVLGGFGIWFALAVHEAGHLAGGLSQGFRFVFLAAGPMWLERGESGIALRLNRTLATWGGMAAAMPQDDRDLRRRFTVMVACGPVASLLLALGSWAAWSMLPLGLARFLAGVTAIASTGFFVATAQPFGAGGGFASDGGRLLRLWRKGPVGEREVAMLALTAAAAGGARPREWTAAVVQAALLPSDGSVMELVAHVYASSRASDVGDPATAVSHLDRAIELARDMSPMLRSLVAAEAAWLRASRGDVEGARPFLAEADGPFVERHALHRARAAVLRAEGDLAGARGGGGGARRPGEDPLRQGVGAGPGAARGAAGRLTSPTVEVTDPEWRGRPPRGPARRPGRRPGRRASPGPSRRAGSSPPG